MKLLTDLLPIIAFFTVFKLVGGASAVYAATAAALTVAALVVAFAWWRERRLDRQQLFTLGVLLVLGGLTLVLKDERYIKWKPSVVSWVMAGAFFGSRWIGRSTLVERMFGSSLRAPAAVWHRLNFAWVLFLAALGALNLHFAFHYPTPVWVNFKVFGTLGLTVVFTFVQALYLMRYDASREIAQGD